MVLGGANPVGSGRSARLDPLALPLRFTASDAAADGRQRQVEIDRDRVVVHRAVRGVRMAVRMPIKAYIGVALRLVAATGSEPDIVTISLEHRDPALSVPLYAADDSDEVVAEWQLWARVLGCPLLVVDHDGTLRAPMVDGSGLSIPAPRRRRRNAIRNRRPSILMRRRLGWCPDHPVYREEREIIARD
jgi:hypothetical protein